MVVINTSTKWSIFNLASHAVTKDNETFLDRVLIARGFDMDFNATFKYGEGEDEMAVWNGTQACFWGLCLHYCTQNVQLGSPNSS